MHSQVMYFELGVYFLRNTLLNFLLVAATLAKNMVYSLTSAFLGKIWVYLNAPPSRPVIRLLESKYHTSNHCYTRCNSKTCAVRFSKLQSIFWPNFRIIDQHLVLIWADFHKWCLDITGVSPPPWVKCVTPFRVFSKSGWSHPKRWPVIMGSIIGGKWFPRFWPGVNLSHWLGQGMWGLGLWPKISLKSAGH